MNKPHLRYFLDDQSVPWYAARGLGREDAFKRMLQRAAASLAPGESIGDAFEGDPRHSGSNVQGGEEYWWFRIQVNDPRPNYTGE
jgi:hypothetical protein